MLFARLGEYEPCGMFTEEHFGLMFATVLGIIIAFKNTVKKTKNEVEQIIKKCTIAMWIFEIIIIIFKLSTGDPQNVNNYVPLYYCSLLLYAGVLSSFAKGTLKKVGDVFLATGSIIGGMVFIIMPTTSLPSYPVLHIVSLQSFLFHGIMVYLGILINCTHYVVLEKTDIKYYASLVGVVCVIAYIINNICDSNLMFISQNFPGTPIELIYNFTGPFFTIVTSVLQMTLPFYIVFGINKLLSNNKVTNENTIMTK